MTSLDNLLTKTSRTFALAIPLLPEPTRSTACLAYLLFRVADTLEDATSWPKAARLEALREWEDFLPGVEPARAKAASLRWIASEVTHHEGYRELLEAMPDVLSELWRMPPEPRRIVTEHALRTVKGMQSVLEHGDDEGSVCVRTVEDLRAYCYVVAGIVGELLTALFLHDCPALEPVRSILVDNQSAFGEGLQLVNILKDYAQDAKEGRMYLPPGVDRSTILDLARQDLACSRRYIGALERGGPPGFAAFTSLLAELAEATLHRIEEDGPGAKVSRAAVLQMFARYRLAASAPAKADHSASAQSGK
jgi:farnesyl-diphosphate farnesyltransferase